jgi:hypothetical protein
LLVIANRIPLEKVFDFGIYLGVPSNEISRLEREYNEDNKKLRFFLLKFWATEVKYNREEEVKMKSLKEAMANIGLHDEIAVIEEVFGSNKDLTNDDFRTLGEMGEQELRNSNILLQMS